MKRFIVQQNLILNATVTLIGTEHNHLRNVLRLQVGDQVILNCGDGNDYYANIVNIAKDSTKLQICKVSKNECDPTKNVTVFQALIKGDNMSLVIQKCTELGVSNFVPFQSKFITAKDKDGKVDKWQTISNQSTKQCRRSTPMHVHATVTFNQMLSMLSAYDTVIFANECEHNQVLDNLASSNYKNVAIIVGSEGGFDADEIKAIIASGAHSVSLGKRILRAETAAIALTSVVMYMLGEWNYEN